MAEIGERKKFLLPPGTKALVDALWVLSTGVLLLLLAEPRSAGCRLGLRTGSSPTLPGAVERSAETGRIKADKEVFPPMAEVIGVEGSWRGA